MKLIERPAVHLALIALLGLAAYSNTFDVPFQWDDKDYIVGNPVVQDLSYFSEPSKAFQSGYSNVPATIKTRRVAYLTFFANYKAHGLAVAGYHAVNLAIHLVNALLVYWFVLLTFRTPFLNPSPPPLKLRGGEGGVILKGDGEGNMNYIALFSALLFVSHPMQTQAVTYICQRFTSLAAMFYLGSLVFYIKWRLGSNSPSPSLPHPQPLSRRERVAGGRVRGFYLFSLLSAVLAMHTKENAFTLPLAIALYEVMFFEGALGKRLLRLFPFLLTMLIIPLTLMDFGKPLWPLWNIVGDITEARPLVTRGEYFLTQFPVVATYLRLLIFPAGQNVDYDYPIFDSLFDPRVFLSFLLLSSLLVFGCYLFFRSFRAGRAGAAEAGLRVISLGIIWFFLTLSVESGLISVNDVIFEHRVYLPSAGAFAAIATGAFLLLRRLRGKRAKTLAVSVLILIPLVLSYAAYTRNKVWGSEIGLWEDVIKKSPQKARGHNNLGNAYAGAHRLDKGIEHFLIAVSLNPDYAEAHRNLGLAYLEMGLSEEARREFITVLQIDPDDQRARMFLNYAD